MQASAESQSCKSQHRSMRKSRVLKLERTNNSYKIELQFFKITLGLVEDFIRQGHEIHARPGSSNKKGLGGIAGPEH